MSEVTSPKYCGCRLQDGRWISTCRAHEPQYVALASLVLKAYEAFRRRAEMPAPREVSP